MKYFVGLTIDDYFSQPSWFYILLSEICFRILLSLLKKGRSGYSKKRKFCGNRHVTEQRKQAKIGIPSAGPSACATTSSSVDTATPPRQHSVSARKIATPESQPVEETEVVAKVFRFIDLSILSTIFKMLPCKECKQFNLELFENSSKRKGCASSLELCCKGCDWMEEFYTSAKINYFFEVNRRLVYSMRSVGCGAAAERFCGLMNMPPIPRCSPYAAHNKALCKVAKEVCYESISDGAQEIQP